MEPSATDEVLIRREGRAGRITMNRPKALNALTYAMVGEIWEALIAWQSDPAVELVLLDGAGGRALCAGGDVRSLYDSRTDGSGFARMFWRDEYRLNALIGHYPKPYVALQDGIVMGGGIGLSGHAAHRIVTERSRLAMPETGIGLIPDVGGTWLLAHAPGAFGAYLGPIGVFPGRGQPRLGELFKKAKAPPLDFGIGYRHRGHDSNLLLAVRRDQLKLGAPPATQAAPPVTTQATPPPAPVPPAAIPPATQTPPPLRGMAAEDKLPAPAEKQE